MWPSQWQWAAWPLDVHWTEAFCTVLKWSGKQESRHLHSQEGAWAAVSRFFSVHLKFSGSAGTSKAPCKSTLFYLQYVDFILYFIEFVPYFSPSWEPNPGAECAYCPWLKLFLLKGGTCFSIFGVESACDWPCLHSLRCDTSAVAL